MHPITAVGVVRRIDARSADRRGAGFPSAVAVGRRDPRIQRVPRARASGLVPALRVTELSFIATGAGIALIDCRNRFKRIRSGRVWGAGDSLPVPNSPPPPNPCLSQICLSQNRWRIHACPKLTSQTYCPKLAPSATRAADTSAAVRYAFPGRAPARSSRGPASPAAA